MPHPYRQDISQARRELAWKLRIRGTSLRGIIAAIEAEGLGIVNESSVSEMISRTRESVRSQLAGSALANQTEQLEALALIASEALSAWERSKEAERLIRERESDEPEIPAPPAAEGQAVPPPIRPRRRRKETVHELRDQVGNPAFLEKALAALADIRKLMGLDEPEKYQVDHRDLSVIESLRGKLLSGASEN